MISLTNDHLFMATMTMTQTMMQHMPTHAPTIMPISHSLR